MDQLASDYSSQNVPYSSSSFSGSSAYINSLPIARARAFASASSIPKDPSIVFCVALIARLQ